MPADLTAYLHGHRRAIAAVLREPFPPDATFVPFYRLMEAPMPDHLQPDRLALNARSVKDFANAHRPADALGNAAPESALVTLRSPVVEHERDADGNTTRLVLRP